MAGAVSVATFADGAALSRPEGEVFLRLWRAFGTARVAAGLVVLLLALTVPESGPRAAALAGGALYVAAALAARLSLAPPTGDLDLRWLASAGLDLLAVGALQWLPGINYTPLFALPVLMAAVLAGAPLAYGSAGAASLLLVLEAATRSPALGGDTERGLLQALLTGAGFFALALLSHQLALRLRREERRARQNQEAARMQAEINALVIQTLTDGVLVVDAQGRVQAINPTACMLLGRQDPQAGFFLGEQAAWGGLMALAREAIAGHGPAPREIRLAPPGVASGGRRLQVRTRLAAAADGGTPVCVMFLADLRELEARIRTEKLAAMGRMSAAVAHEIRNPLAAITQANALLAEDLRDPALRPLTDLVDQNAQRLARIVDDVLDMARARSADPAESPPLRLDDTVRALCGEWGGLHLLLDAPQAQVAFDPEHLRRVLVNLLDNAQRHASSSGIAVQVATGVAPEGGWQLAVWSEGEPLDPSVQAHLFEPFFSSDSRSSGLGLFICRELCLRHGARIHYGRAPAPASLAASAACASPLASAQEGNVFAVRFSTAGPTPAATISP